MCRRWVGGGRRRRRGLPARGQLSAPAGGGGRRNSQATVLETHAADPAAGGYFVCPGRRVRVPGGGRCSGTRASRSMRRTRFTLGFQHARIERAAVFDSSSLSFGGGLVRNDTVALLDGEGADCSLDGLYVVGGSRFVDNHMRVEHRQPRTTSHQLYKGVLDDRARSVFNGRIYVHQAAQKTDAKQTNRNLLLYQVGPRQQQPPARDLRGRCALHPRLDDRPAGRGRPLLSEGSRHPPRGGSRHAGLRVCPGAGREGLLRAAPGGPGGPVAVEPERRPGGGGRSR